jgi:hypothetical protein
MRRLVLLAAAAFAVVWSAPASGAAKGPCALITAANVSAALGAKVAPATNTKLGLYESCDYVAGVKRLVILDRTTTRKLFDTSAKKNPGPVVHLSGIGSDAYSAQGGAVLLMWDNGTELTILVTGTTNALKIEETLGRDAASRL